MFWNKCSWMFVSSWAWHKASHWWRPHSFPTLLAAAVQHQVKKPLGVWGEWLNNSQSCVFLNSSLHLYCRDVWIIWHWHSVNLLVCAHLGRLLSVNHCQLANALVGLEYTQTCICSFPRLIAFTGTSSSVCSRAISSFEFSKMTFSSLTIWKI